MFETYPKWILYLRGRTLKFFHKYSVPSWMVFLIDIIIVFVTFILANLLRYNFVHSGNLLREAYGHSLLILVIYALFFLIFRSYAGMIRHTTLSDVSLVFGAATSSTVVLMFISEAARFFGLGWPLLIPFSIILIQYGLVTISMFFFRVSVKLIFQFGSNTAGTRRNVLIYGAGELGFIVKRIIMSDPQNELNVVGFIDDSKKFQGKKINGIPVTGSEILKTQNIQKLRIKAIIIAINQLNLFRKKEILKIALDLGLEVYKVPTWQADAEIRINIKNLQKIKLEDLLEKGPNVIDHEKIKNGLTGKTILITGAAGSIGSEIARQVARFSIGKIVLLDNAETPLFQIENEFRKDFKGKSAYFHLADVTNSDKMEGIFRMYKPDIVFHVAAYKHVPVLEMNPHEAFRVNVVGTKVIAGFSVLHNVSTFALISSDKCFNPSGAMSASKRISEIIIQELAHKPEVKTKFIITRFGNVLGSNGSVIPIFADQIENGGPVTVTHPDISRHFMTIPQACELVLESAFMSNKGGMYAFDMGNPVKIADLARKMIQLSGLELNKDIEIIYSGLRLGENLEEEEIKNMPDIQPTSNPGIKLVQYLRTDYSEVVSRIDNINDNLYSMSGEAVREILREMVEGDW